MICSLCGYETGMRPSGLCEAHEADRLSNEPPDTRQSVRAEKWKSSENREEVHYFIEGTQVYAVGFNPAVISEDGIKTLLRDAGLTI